MYRILLPLDKKTHVAGRIAEAVTALPGASEFEVFIMHVYEDIDLEDAEGPRLSSGDLYDVEETPESVRIAAERLESANASVTTLIEEGDPKDVILSTIDEQGIDHVFMGGRRRSPVGKAVFGSVSQGVLLNSDVPVTVVVHDQ